MPRRFISPTTSLPNAVRPSCFGSSVAESAQSLFARVGERHVARAGVRRAGAARPRELSIEWPPSMPISEAILPALVDAHDVVGGERELERVGIRGVEAMHDVDLLERGLHRVRALQRRRDVDGPELRADAARREARDVGVQRLLELRLVLAEVDLRELVLHPLAVLPGQVVVAVDERDVAEDAVDARVLGAGVMARRSVRASVIAWRAIVVVSAESLSADGGATQTRHSTQRYHPRPCRSPFSRDESPSHGRHAAPHARAAVGGAEPRHRRARRHARLRDPALRSRPRPRADELLPERARAVPARAAHRRRGAGTIAKDARLRERVRAAHALPRARASRGRGHGLGHPRRGDGVSGRAVRRADDPLDDASGELRRAGEVRPDLRRVALHAPAARRRSRRGCGGWRSCSTPEGLLDLQRARRVARAGDVRRRDPLRVAQREPRARRRTTTARRGSPKSTCASRLRRSIRASRASACRARSRSGRTCTSSRRRRSRTPRRGACRRASSISWKSRDDGRASARMGDGRRRASRIASRFASDDDRGRDDATSSRRAPTWPRASASTPRRDSGWQLVDPARARSARSATRSSRSPRSPREGEERILFLGTLDSLIGYSHARRRAHLEQRLAVQSQELASMRHDLAVAAHQRAELQAEIAAMRQSRFWKARDAWFAVKAKFGGTGAPTRAGPRHSAAWRRSPG